MRALPVNRQGSLYALSETVMDMKRILPALITTLLVGVVAIVLVGLLAKGDHRTDRNIPGATTGPGRASMGDPE
jgi:hypothetical protein